MTCTTLSAHRQTLQSCWRAGRMPSAKGTCHVMAQGMQLLQTHLVQGIGQRVGWICGHHQRRVAGGCELDGQRRRRAGLAYAALAAEHHIPPVWACKFDKAVHRRCRDHEAQKDAMLLQLHLAWDASSHRCNCWAWVATRHDDAS